MDLRTVLLIIALIFIALCIACAVRVACRRTPGDASRRGAGDPFFYPFGEMPTVPRERHLIPGDFSAWGIPTTPRISPSAGAALLRNESGGRNRSHASAAVLTFPKVRP